MIEGKCINFYEHLKKKLLLPTDPIFDLEKVGNIEFTNSAILNPYLMRLEYFWY